MRITIVVSSLTAGGAERAASVLAGELGQRGNILTMITKSRSTSTDYWLPESISVLEIGRDSGPQGFFGRLAAVKKRSALLRSLIIKSRPEIVVSFTTIMNVRTLVACRGLSVPVVVSERNDPARCKIKFKWALMRRILYPRATMLVSVSRGVDRGFPWLPERKKRVIPNMVSPALLASTTGQPKKQTNVPQNNDMRPLSILAVGRLTYQKGFDLLIAALARINGKVPPWRLTIVGSGPEEFHLQKLIDDNSMQNKVAIHGFTSDIAAYYRESDVFVLSSRYEGMPNTVLEAMSFGLLVISFKCPSGPDEIITHSYDGLLVEPENIQALADAISWALKDEALRKTLAVKAKKTIQEKFAPDIISRKWDKLFEKMLAPRKRPDN